METQEIKNAMTEARWMFHRAEEIARYTIEFAAGRLRRLNIGHAELVELKKELRSYDMHRQKWASKPNP